MTRIPPHAPQGMPSFAADPADRWRMARPRVRRVAVADLWWLHPGRAVLLLIVPVYLSFVLYDFGQVEVTDYIPSPHYIWGLCLLCMLALGGVIGADGAARRVYRPLRAPIEIPRWTMAMMLGAALVGYAIWFGPALTDPSLLLSIIAGERRNLRDVLDTQAGITSLTQCGVAYAIACAIKPGLSGRRLVWWERLGLALVLGLATVRAVAWAERLALIEIVVCYVIARMAFREVRPGARQWLAIMPIIAPIAVYLAFTATEYFRTWEFYSAEYDSIWAFTFDRLVAYYATASNNGIGLLTETRQWPEFSGRYVAEWAYALPEVGPWLERASETGARLAYSDFLWDHARPEFNNPTGIFPIVYDIGWIGSAVYFFLVGLLVGRAYRAFAARELFGLLLYPVCFLFLLELLRFNYLAASRFVLIAASFALIALAARPLARRRNFWRPQPLAT